jgi:hypothetical protein
MIWNFLHLGALLCLLVLGLAAYNRIGRTS